MKIISIFFILTVWQSCIQDIDVDIDFESKLVLNGFVSTAENWSMNIQKSGNIFSETDTIGSIEGADVLVHDLTDNTMVRLVDNGDGNYSHDSAKPKVGHRYEVKVSAEGFETISAITDVPKPVSILKKEDTLIVINGIQTVKVDFEILDIEYQDHFYICELYKVSKDSTEFNVEKETQVYSNVEQEDEAEGRRLNSGIRYLIKNNTTTNTSDFSAFLGNSDDNDDGGNTGSNESFSYELSVISVSKSFFEYTQYIEEYINSTPKESGKVPAYKIPSNVNNGYGIIGTSNKQLFVF